MRQLRLRARRARHARDGPRGADRGAAREIAARSSSATDIDRATDELRAAPRGDPRPRGAARCASARLRVGAHERVPRAPPRATRRARRRDRALPRPRASRTRRRGDDFRELLESSSGCARSSSSSASAASASAAARRPTTRRRSRSASGSRRSSSWRATCRGQLRAISPEQLRELLVRGRGALADLILRDLERDAARRAGYLRGGERRRAHAARDPPHRRAGAGRGLRRRCARAGPAPRDRRSAAPRCRGPTRRGPSQFGDPLDLDVVRTLLNAREARARRRRASRPAAPRRARARGLRGARARLHHADHHGAAARHELVDVVGGPLPGGEARRARARPPDPHALPARPLLRGRLLDARARAADPRAARRELGHGRPVHEPPGRAA